MGWTWKDGILKGAYIQFHRVYMDHAVLLLVMTQHTRLPLKISCLIWTYIEVNKVLVKLLVVFRERNRALKEADEPTVRRERDVL
jgi:hypothetical protein